MARRLSFDRLLYCTITYSNIYICAKSNHATPRRPYSARTVSWLVVGGVVDWRTEGRMDLGAVDHG